jgi:hypothetical protein
MIKRMKGEERQSDRRRMKSENDRKEKKKENLENLEIQLLLQYCIHPFKILHSIEQRFKLEKNSISLYNYCFSFSQIVSLSLNLCMLLSLSAVSSLMARMRFI